MKSSFGITLLLLISFSGALAQKTKKAVILDLSANLEQYSYPYLTIQNNTTSTQTGCFIKMGDSTYFVTARNHFFTPVNEQRKFSNVLIFLEPGHNNFNARALSLNMKTQRIIPVCMNELCTDIVLLPVAIPADFKINFVEIDPAASVTGKELFIVGYVQDSTSIIKTSFYKELPRDQQFFLTNHSNMKDQSGSPVLMPTVSGGKTKVVLTGIYSGRELYQENFNKGLVVRANLISEFLEGKKRVPPAKPFKKGKKIM